MNYKLLFVVFAAVYACYVDGQSTCDSGTCTSILQCPVMLELVSKSNRTSEELETLKKAQCGFEGNKPKVCCPELCYNPDGKPGKCVNINQCEHLATMLKPPLSRPDNMVYVQNSKCTGSDRFSVCCGPPRVINKDLNTRCTGILAAGSLPDPNTECCGRNARIRNKITNGNSTSIDYNPWSALIEYTKNSGSGPLRIRCGGTLISWLYVLTAAHCVAGAILKDETPRNVRLGEYDTTNPGKDCALPGNDDCNNGAISIPIDEIIPHPEYNTSDKQRKNDIALIRIKQAAPFNDLIRPACLPTMDITSNPPDDFTLFAAGWGVSKAQSNSAIKLHVDLPFVPTPMCQMAYRAPGRNIDLGKGQLCAGGQPGKDSCRGDSGGSLMWENKDMKINEVIGVLSYRPTPCDLPDIPGVYTKVFEYNDWIRSQIRV